MTCYRHISYCHVCFAYFFFFNDTATTEIYTLSLHDALPILATEATALLHGRGAAEAAAETARRAFEAGEAAESLPGIEAALPRSEEHTSEIQSRQYLVCRLLLEKKKNKNITEHQLSKQ